jgi:hypothetical protein
MISIGVLQLFALAAQAPTDTEKGILQGVVTSAGTNQPLPNVTVRLSGGPPDPQAVQRLLSFFASRGVVVNPQSGQSDDQFFQNLIDTAAARGLSMVNPEVQNALMTFQMANNSRFTGMSDAAGRFTIRSIAPGRYTVEGSRDDHFSGSIDSLIDSSNPAISTTISPGQTSEVRLSLIPGATVSGRVSNAAGRHLSNVTVVAFVVIYQNGFPILQNVAQDTTDDHGDYRLFWLPSGEYLVAAIPPRGDSTGGRQQVRTFYPATTEALMARAILVRDGQEMAGFDVEMQTASSFKVSGEIISSVPPPSAPAVVGANVGPTTATITILAHDPSVPDNVASRTLGSVTLSPIGDGKSSSHFEVEGILPGSYDISTWMRESNPDGGSSITIARTPIEVSDQDVSGVVLNVYSSVRVLGNVTLDGHAPERATVRISLQPDGSENKVPVYLGIGSRAVVANPQDGSFMVPAVTSGRFKVQIGSGLPTEVYVADVLQGGLSIYDSGFDVAGKSPAPIEVILKSGAAVLDGVVQDTTGKPVPNAAVVLIPPMNRRENRALYRTATADATGHFTIRGITPENYHLFAWQKIAPSAYYNPRFLAKYEDHGRAITLGQSSTLTATITAIPVEVR